MNYFQAINIPIPERFFLKSLIKINRGKRRFLHELEYINQNWHRLSDRCFRIMTYGHWLYISAFMSLNVEFLKRFNNKIVPSALINNKNCYFSFNMWTLPLSDSTFKYKIIKCLKCENMFTTYRNKRIDSSYYKHECYLSFFKHLLPNQYYGFYCIYYLGDLRFI